MGIGQRPNFEPNQLLAQVFTASLAIENEKIRGVGRPRPSTRQPGCKLRHHPSRIIVRHIVPGPRVLLVRYPPGVGQAF